MEGSRASYDPLQRRVVSLVDEVRSACARVAGQARWVRIADERIEAYARSLTAPASDLGADPSLALLEGPREDRAAFALTLDAINFGSGWWPEIRKRRGCSGFTTMALGLRERFEVHGRWRPEQLAEISAAELARALGQHPGHELMGLYAEALRDLGGHVCDQHGASFAAVADAVGGSAVALTELLAGWRCFEDASIYSGRPVPFFKRAQLACADLAHAEAARFADLDRLTLFADNLIPHVLRVDGVLLYDADLVSRIDAGELLEHCSEEEIEIRACAVEAVERMALVRPELSPQKLDHLLWNRGRGERYKSRPRHRARCTAY
jgi:Potential Queuosine, Q, salvage protein family